MAEKDITERDLEWFNDIFADIANAFFVINGGWAEIKPEDLTDARARTSYKSGDKVREQERDEVKLWHAPDGETVICLVGMENQTAVDTYMALRVFGYEGADIRSQIPPRRKKGERYPAKKPHEVLTIIVYFGIRRRWPRRRSLQERLKVPEWRRKFESDTPVNVLELAFLTEEQEALFKSEFRHIVHYLRQARKGEPLDVLPEPAVKHTREFFALLKALTKEEQYDELSRQVLEKQKGEETDMKLPSLLDAMVDKGRSEERRIIMERMIADGMDPNKAASYAGLSGGLSNGGHFGEISHT